MSRCHRSLGPLAIALLLVGCDDASDGSSSSSGGGAGSSSSQTSNASTSVTSTTDASSSADASSSDASSSTGAPVCGDGVVAFGEACDDGNGAALDGCDATCNIENGYTCNGSAPSACTPICGDGLIVGGEECDDANAMTGDGCTDTCTIEGGYGCDGTPSACAPTCGDGMIVGGEACDDANAMTGDGCSDGCEIEHGFECMLAPSVCMSTCGDALVASDEGCDDGNTAATDGCSATCGVENGFACGGEPSACATVCGDGIVAGMEQCDDGNLAPLDGCVGCVAGTGETCADPLGISLATVMNGKYTWTIPAGGPTTAEAPMACDPNGHGPDAFIVYTKTTDTVANGGELLHVFANPAQTATSYYLDVEVTSAGCGAVGTVEKCLWYKHDWDTYLDVPAGTYWIAIAKNSAATATVLFPETLVQLEEVPASAAEGEGCFAPYTSASAIYTPPATPADFHVWSVPATINSFDMGPEWGEPGSISCDNTAPYGDIHGVDAVIRFDKTSPTSVLYVEAQNLAPTLSASDLNVEILDVCDATNTSKVSRNCRANLDSIAITAPSPAGPVYIWVSTEATGEELDGATLRVREIFPGPGESWPTAQPLVAGAQSITPNSTMRLDVPSCMPPLGNVHWYAYTLQNDAISISGTGVGPIGVYDEHGQPVQCVADGSTSSIGALGVPGDVFYVAVPSAGAVTALNVLDVDYDGVGASVKDLDITFPTSAVADQGMTVGPTSIYLGTTTKTFEFAKTGSDIAKEHAAGDGLTATHLGYDLVFAGANLLSVDSTTTTTASRLYRIFDGTTWGPTAWDLAPTYAASSPSHAIATDGTTVFMATRRTTTSADFYSLSQTAPSTPVGLGTNTTVWYVTGLAADSQFFYVASNGTAGEGVYRISRSAVGAAAVKIATLNTDTLTTNIEVDDLTLATLVYVRAAGDTYAIVDPRTSPITLPISTLGTTSDYAMTYDRTAQALYLFETETDSAGRIVELK